MSVWGVMAIAAGIVVAAIVDLSLGLGWGFSSNDIVMSLVVLAVVIGLRLIGTKIITFFGRGP
jgi:hypothetical protein